MPARSMPLSISNSRIAGGARGLRSIAAATVVSVGLYAGLIALWQPTIGAGQDQESDVAIAVERFLYADAVPDAAIVGSSQAWRIPTRALGPRVVNLALAAHNAITGLEIIARSGRVPRRIYVETNMIGRVRNDGFVDGVFAEPGFTLKRYVAALRTTYQPANVAISLLRRAVRGRDEVDYPRVQDRALHDTLIAGGEQIMTQPPDPRGLANDVAKLERLAGVLSSAGAELVFFEMPIEPRLEETNAVVAVRAAVHAAFPADRACWNQDTPPLGLVSSDGTHLDSETAAQFWTTVAATTCHRPAVAAMPGK
jgi:hypothetical protein